MLQNLGIAASHTGPATYIQNIYNATGQDSPQEVERFNEVTCARREMDIVDAEYTEEMASFDEDALP